MGFDIITWPGYLCIAGDMGDYLFARTPDMFEFFRGKADRPLEINPRYWAEKTRNNKTTEYSPEKFRESINSYLEDRDSVTDELRQAVNDEVLCHAHDGEWAAVTAAHEFQHGRFQFEEFYESQYKDWTYHYLWCCYAVVWSIRQYDAAKVLANTKPCPACSAPLIVCERCEGGGDEPHTDNDVTGPALCKGCNGLGGNYAAVKVPS